MSPANEFLTGLPLRRTFVRQPGYGALHFVKVQGS